MGKSLPVQGEEGRVVVTNRVGAPGLTRTGLFRAGEVTGRHKVSPMPRFAKADGADLKGDVSPLFASLTVMLW